MRQVDRRTFLRGSAVTAGAVALGGPFQGFARARLRRRARSRPSASSERSRISATARSASGCPRVSGTASSTTPSPRSSSTTGPCCRAGTTAWGNGSGQIWAYRTAAQHLQLLFQSPGADVLDLPDNVTTSRRGTLIHCEDSSGDNFLRGLTRGGRSSTWPSTACGPPRGRRGSETSSRDRRSARTGRRSSSTSRHPTG